MKKVLYFAYGSNLSESRLVNRVGNVKVVGNFALHGYDLTFNASNGYSSYANITKVKYSSYVEGVLYDLTNRQFELLDRYEGLYSRYYFDVNVNTLGCVYIANEQVEGAPTDRFYLDIIRDECRRLNFLRNYDAVSKQYANSIEHKFGVKSKKKRNGRVSYFI